MPPTTAIRTARHLVNLADSKGARVSNLKLQKLLYYAQAWYLAIRREALFEEDIEAWVHGPVVPCVFRTYKKYNWSPLDPEVAQPLPHTVARHLDEVWDAYGKFSGFELARITHSEEPWRAARKGLAPDEPSNNVISKKSMQKYYSSLLHGKE